MAKILQTARVINGELYQHLKDIKLVGRVREESSNDFIIYGCVKGFEKAFYQGVLNYDKTREGIGFKTVEDVESFWTEGGELIFLCINNGDYEIIN